MTAASDPVLALDIGGTKIAAALVDGATIAQRRQAPTPRDGSGETLVRAIAELVAPLLAHGRGLAVASTGIVDQGALTALNPVTLPIENRFPLADRLSSVLGRTAVLVNDAQAAAWGEYLHGAGQGTENFAFLTVSTGIGGGLVLDRRLVTGRRGFAGHLGHVCADPNGPACGCGRRGCIEAIASGTAIAAEASRVTGEALDAVAVFARGEQGDPACAAIIERAARHLAELLADLAAAFDVDRIALGGGVGLADGFLPKVTAALKALPVIFRRPVMPAALGADAGLVGAAAISVLVHSAG